MNRLQEVEFKHGQIRQLLAQQHAAALLIRRTRNLAWITAGADASIPIEAEYGMYSILITPDKRIVYTNNIEATRLHGEDQLEDFGFEYHEYLWHGAAPHIPYTLLDDGPTEAALLELRSVLTPNEQERYRQLGADAARALESVVRSLDTGLTEFQIAARLDAACKAVGGWATVNLIATDERITQYRHPLATHKKLDKYAMVIVCMRRAGLIAAATRLGYLGKMPDELVEKQNTIAAIDAEIMVASRPGKTLGELFEAIKIAYTANGQAGQWDLHHQGGTIAYQGREKLALPGEPSVLVAGQALAWNPSIRGCKSEDTIILHEQGFENITAHAEDWPSVLVNVGDQVVRKAGILEL